MHFDYFFISIDNTESPDSLHESCGPLPKSHDTITGSCDYIGTDDDSTAITRLPDRPTDVVVRPSFKDGGIYIMWNPVRYAVLKYMVDQSYIDGACSFKLFKFMLG